MKITNNKSNSNDPTSMNKSKANANPTQLQTIVDGLTVKLKNAREPTEKKLLLKEIEELKAQIAALKAD